MPHKLLLADDSVTIQRVIELTFADEKVEAEALKWSGMRAVVTGILKDDRVQVTGVIPAVVGCGPLP